MPASSVWLLVLARDPAAAKTRLGPVLDPSARAELAVAMLRDVLAAARAVPFARHLVVTESATVRAVAAESGFETLSAPSGGTNVAAMAALRAAESGGAAAALVLAADLPLLRADDLERMVEASRGAAVVIAADRHERGTNALLLSPPTAIAPSFGADSLRAHRASASASGARVAMVATPGLATDIDDADDLRAIADARMGEHTASVLRTHARSPRATSAS